jgi:DNA-binding NtrC family response regulator
MSKPVLLLVDDNEELVISLTRVLRNDYEVRSAGSQAEALRQLLPPPDIALLDMRLREDEPENRDGISLLQTLRQQFPQLPVLMNTAHGDMEAAAECVRLGATDFIDKSRADVSEIKTRLARALDQARLWRRVSDLEQELSLIEPRNIIGVSQALQEIKQSIEAVAADGRITVLIQGESGTGKELIARALHASGWRRAHPFVPVVLASLPHDLVEGELFGYEVGAFTDARKRHIGYLEKAKDGVLFLDEIGDLDARLQVKLLRFLEERELQRLGSTSAISVDLQVVAATNADLWARVLEGRFREDLYFRLKGFEVHIPPLRERREDIPLLVDHFLKTFRQQGRMTLRFSPQAMDCLHDYHWPGNVRQLRNAVESALFRAGYRKHLQVEPEDLPVELWERGAVADAPPTGSSLPSAGQSLEEALAQMELALIERALQQVNGRKTEAWKLLGLNDRFALRRRVIRIWKQYPALLDAFPYVKLAYEREAPKATARG